MQSRHIHLSRCCCFSAVFHSFYFFTFESKMFINCTFRNICRHSSHTVFFFLYLFLLSEYYEFGQLISHFAYYLVAKYTHLEAQNLYGTIVLHFCCSLLIRIGFIIILFLWSWLIVESDCERMDRKRHQWPEGTRVVWNSRIINSLSSGLSAHQRTLLSLYESLSFSLSLSD